MINFASLIHSFIHSRGKFTKLMQEKVNAQGKKSIRPVLRLLKVGHSEAWPLAQRASVHANSYQLGLEMGRKFQARTDRERGQYILTRIE